MPVLSVRGMNKGSHRPGEHSAGAINSGDDTASHGLDKGQQQLSLPTTVRTFA
jgi:hypothetical protein